MTLTAEQFRQIVESLRSDSLSKRSYEKRTAPRVGVRTKLGIIPLDAAPAASPAPRTGPAFVTAAPEGAGTLHVWVRDISADGIGVLHSAPMESGARFVAHFHRPGRPPMAVAYTVTHCRTISKTLFTIGAKLDRIIDDPWTRRG
jgi:hypothetical protein